MKTNNIFKLFSVLLIIYLLALSIASADEATVTRDLPDQTIDEGSTFTVTLSPVGFFIVGTVTEVLPAGYSYVSGSAQNVDLDDFDFSSGTLKLNIDSNVTNVTYEVTADNVDGTFTGTFATVDANADPVLGDVTGDSIVTISETSDDSSSSSSNGHSSSGSSLTITKTSTPEPTTENTTDPTTQPTTEPTTQPTTQPTETESSPTIALPIVVIIGLILLISRKK
jgi:hypothetical protein